MINWREDWFWLYKASTLWLYKAYYRKLPHKSKFTTTSQQKHLVNINPLSANPTKWSNTLNNSLTVFDHFVILALKGLTSQSSLNMCLTEPWYWQCKEKWDLDSTSKLKVHIRINTVFKIMIKSMFIKVTQI